MAETRVVITGGSGRLGRFIAAELGTVFPTTIVDRAGPAHDGGTIEADVCDFAATKAALQHGNLLVHLAGIDASVKAHASEVYRVNTVGTWNVLQAAEELRYKKVILCSSVAALGLDGAHKDNVPTRLPVTDDSELRPYHAYGLSKRVSEEIGFAFFRRTGIPTLCLRPALVLFPELREGFIDKARNRPFDRPIEDSRLREALEEPLPLLRSYIFPEDVAAAFRLAAETNFSGYGIYNLAAADILGDEPLEAHVRAAYGAAGQVVFGNIYRSAPSASSLDTGQAWRDLGWSPKTSWRTNRD
jgi:nucleoside-diphosphate-sugar epimerase